MRVSLRERERGENEVNFGVSKGYQVRVSLIERERGENEVNLGVSKGY